MDDKNALFNPIGEKVFKLRNLYVMLDRDIAGIYGLETRRLNEAVKRNIDRFDDDFMFQLNEKDIAILKSQIATLNLTTLRRALPYAFTELGISMLSSVLNSDIAIRVNKQIMRYFVHMRKLEINNSDFRKFVEAKLKLHDEKLNRSDINFEVIFSLLDSYKTRNDQQYKKSGKIGFKKND